MKCNITKPQHWVDENFLGDVLYMYMAKKTQ